MTTSMRRAWFVAPLLLAGLLPSAAAAEKAEVLIGRVLVGVDTLGRVLVAVDQLPVDGLVDQCFLFTAAERLEGPWSEKFDLARVTVDAGALTIGNSPPTHLISLSVIGSEPLPAGAPPHVSTFSRDDGMELSRMKAGAWGAAIDSMSVLDIHTWPEAFWYDLLAPESGPCDDDDDCLAGGKGSPSCSLTIRTSCSVTCSGDTYACCFEAPAGGVRCRCRPCITGP